MPKQFQRRRLASSKAPTKFFHSKFFLVVGVILLFFLLLPLVRLLIGPLGGFVWRAPQILGSRYVVLLQNEAELRPTGGFLSAFAVVDFSGISPKISVYDSYAVADPVSPIAAPKAISDVFGSDPKFTGWEFRDANFSPDFAESAQQALTFLRQDSRFSTTDFDGVIAVNVAAVAALLEHFDIQQPDDLSLFLSLQRATKDIDLHSSEELATRKNALGEIAQLLKKKIGYFSSPAVAKILAIAADKKELQFWFADKSLMHVATEHNWDGRLTANNAFAINIANLGAKKSDHFVRRQLYSDIFVATDGVVEEQFRLRMQNSSPANLLSGEGMYFIRVIRPAGTKIISDIAGWEQRSLAFGEEFSTLQKLVPEQEITLEVRFELPFVWTSGARDFVWQKQSGTDDTLFLSLRGQSEMLFSTNNCDHSLPRENVLYCQTLLDTDKTFEVVLTPDKLPPIVEDIFFQSERDIFIRFSEPITEQNSPENILLTCKNAQYSIKEILSNSADLRDRTLVLTTEVPFDDELCTFTWNGVSDAAQNQADIRMTLPLRLSP